jgi:ZIP family zinc transporter
MHIVVYVVLLPWIAGLTAFVGGIVAAGTRNVHLLRRNGATYHGMVAFGGGILVAAVTFALLPEALNNLNVIPLSVTFIAGGAVFAYVDKLIARSQGVGAQFLAMLVDFIPEAISFGAVFGHDHRLGYLLAGFIGLQNLPEGFNAFHESVLSGSSTRKTLVMLFSVSFLGPLAGIVGFLVLQGLESVTAAIMSFAAGGILYLVFQDIAAQSRMVGRTAPPLGAILGFALGMAGNELIKLA